jgi:hypothetical protein
MTDLDDLDAEKQKAQELLHAFDHAVFQRLPMPTSAIFNAALNLLLKIIKASDDPKDPNGMAQFAIDEIKAFVQETATRRRQ